MCDSLSGSRESRWSSLRAAFARTVQKIYWELGAVVEHACRTRLMLFLVRDGFLIFDFVIFLLTFENSKNRLFQFCHFWPNGSIYIAFSKEMLLGAISYEFPIGNPLCCEIDANPKMKR